MSVRWTPRSTLAAMLVLVVLGLVAPASATDNTSGIHWHASGASFQVTDSVPADWDASLAQAAATWSSYTPLQLSRGPNLPATYADFTDPSVHAVSLGAIPPEWWLSCPPPTTLACTRWSDDDLHLSDADLVFHAAFLAGFTTNTSNCPLNWPSGPFYDVETLALHEFGHFGVLRHSIDSNAVMYAEFRGCRRALTSHDIDSMGIQYLGH